MPYTIHTCEQSSIDQPEDLEVYLQTSIIRKKLIELLHPISLNELVWMVDVDRIVFLEKINGKDSLE